MSCCRLIIGPRPHRIFSHLLRILSIQTDQKQEKISMNTLSKSFTANFFATQSDYIALLLHWSHLVIEASSASCSWMVSNPRPQP